MRLEKFLDERFVVKQDKVHNLETLLGSELFNGVDLERLKEMDVPVSRRSLRKNEILIEEGTESPNIYVLESGDIEVTFSVPGEENFLKACRLREGSVIGEMALLEDDVHSARVVAASKASVIEINSQKFLAFLDENPDIGYIVMRNLAKVVSGRLRYTDQFVRHITAS